MLKGGQTCVTDKNVDPGEKGFGGRTLPDHKAGWGADIIILNKKFVTDAKGGDAATATAEQKEAFKKLMGVLAHEGVHAGDPVDHGDEDTGKQTNKQLKEQEQKAAETEKKVLKECGYTAAGSRYEFLCFWLKELCSHATRSPDNTPARGCPWVIKNPGQDPGTPEPEGPRTPDYGSASSYQSFTEEDPDERGQPHTILVDGSPDRQVYTDVAFPAFRMSYPDVPTQGDSTLLIVDRRTQR